ncbi:hypothetical protein EYC84_002850 [Monilinia fructicola]|uniref:Uncharacterized protein n=1 Tax=Monilinia fructicola TaxID=38448 RepID=A0A5M9JQA8_MONFR|nr:hypothetical protein EYC84_002850 [Monilinia fructicola]
MAFAPTIPDEIMTHKLNTLSSENRFHWTEEQNKIFLSFIKNYRVDITNVSHISLKPSWVDLDFSQFENVTNNRGQDVLDDIVSKKARSKLTTIIKELERNAPTEGLRRSDRNQNMRRGALALGALNGQERRDEQAEHKEPPQTTQIVLPAIDSKIDVLDSGSSLGNMKEPVSALGNSRLSDEQALLYLEASSLDVSQVGVQSNQEETSKSFQAQDQSNLENSSRPLQEQAQSHQGASFSCRPVQSQAQTNQENPLSLRLESQRYEEIDGNGKALFSKPLQSNQQSNQKASFSIPSQAKVQSHQDDKTRWQEDRGEAFQDDGKEDKKSVREGRKEDWGRSLGDDRKEERGSVREHTQEPFTRDPLTRKPLIQESFREPTCQYKEESPRGQMPGQYNLTPKPQLISPIPRNPNTNIGPLSRAASRLAYHGNRMNSVTPISIPTLLTRTPTSLSRAASRLSSRVGSRVCGNATPMQFSQFHNGDPVPLSSSLSSSIVGITGSESGFSMNSADLNKAIDELSENDLDHNYNFNNYNQNHNVS